MMTQYVYYNETDNDKDEERKAFWLRCEIFYFGYLSRREFTNLVQS